MAKNFIASAIKRPGALHRALHVPQGQKIPLAKVLRAAQSPGRLGQEGRLAETLAKLRKK